MRIDDLHRVTVLRKGEWGMILPLLNILARVMNHDSSTEKHKTHLGINILVS